MFAELSFLLEMTAPAARPTQQTWPCAQRVRLPFFGSLLLALLAACAPEGAVERTQVIVAVSADPLVAARLARVEVRLYETLGELPPVARVERFAFDQTTDAGEAHSASWPFSFGVERSHTASFRIELLGYATWAPDAAPVIERKELVRFVAAQTSAVSIYLAADCLDQALRCAALSITCAAGAAEVCVPLGEATLRPVVTAPQTALDASPDGSLDARMPEGAWPGTTESTLPGIDGADAGAADLPELPPERLPVCPVTGACPRPAYPCIPSDDGLGYSCRGEYAAWPMPDGAPAAKTPARYTIRADAGVVLDEVTGLSWQRALPATYRGCSGRLGGAVGDGCTWEEAKHYCSQLRLADKRWRLPTKIELESLLYDRAEITGKATIDLDVFPDTPFQSFWTASPVPYDDSGLRDVFAISFSAASTSYPKPDALNRVRCVRSERNANAPPSQHYLVDWQARTVLDVFTGLTWEASASPSPVTLEEAQARCEQVGLRLPTHKELLTLDDLTRGTDEQNVNFPLLDPTQLLWSSSPAQLGGNIVYSSSVGGILDSGSLSSDYALHVRCVK